MGHDHGHAVSAAGAHRSRMLIALGITVAVLIAEVIGAQVSGSLALLADAGHMLTDVAGMGLAILAITVAARPASSRRTFGYYRLEILAAVVNAMLLLAVTAYILIESWLRWQSDPEVSGGLMLVFALIGLVANVVSMMLLRAGAQESLNVRGAYLEAFGDLLGSGAVIVAAVVIAITGWARADIVASVAVAIMILPRAWSLLREAIDVLLEAAPKGIELEAIREHVLGIDGVIGVHDLHAWTITSGMPVLSAHVVVEDAVLDAGGSGRILDALGECLAHHFDVAHSTFQLESPAHAAHEFDTHD